MNSNAKRDAACEKAGYFDGPGNGEGVAFREGWSARDAEVAELKSRILEFEGMTFSENEKIAELQAQLKTRDEAIDVAVKALEHFKDCDCDRKNVIANAITKINTLLGREG